MVLFLLLLIAKIDLIVKIILASLVISKKVRGLRGLRINK
jgi:hypothetical protein